MSEQSDGASAGQPSIWYRAFGRIAAILVLLLVLVAGPLWMIQLNADWNWPRWQVPAGRVIGSALMLGAVVIWLYCSRLFARIGKGTPFVTEPPKRLVAEGLYRYSRNPIYVGHVAFLMGWFLRSGCLAMFLYTVAIAALIQIEIIWLEEPGLRERFGEEYVHYTRRVPRWLIIPPGGGA